MNQIQINCIHEILKSILIISGFSADGEATMSKFTGSSAAENS